MACISLLSNPIEQLYHTDNYAVKRTKDSALKIHELTLETNAEILDTLAMVYFVNGKIKDAVETEQKALKLEPENERFKGNLKKYEEKGK